MKTAGEFLSSGPERSLRWGKELAGQLQRGDIVLLIGELGAGKSVIARGLARGLGYQGVVSSPSFTLVKTYPGKLKIDHCDLYRIGPQDDLRDLGLENLLEPEGITIFEWGERSRFIVEARPRWEVRIEFTEVSDQRHIQWEKIE